jgi:hypothetical protein
MRPTLINVALPMAVLSDSAGRWVSAKMGANPLARPRRINCPQFGGALLGLVTSAVSSATTAAFVHAKAHLAKNSNISLPADTKRSFNNQRADYAKQIVKQVAQQLTYEYGKGFNEKSLRKMMQFYQAFPQQVIVSTLSRQLSWSHFVELLPIKAALAREFYLQMAINDRWSVRTLRNRIDSMLFERTAISKQPDELIALELNALRLKEADKANTAPRCRPKKCYNKNCIRLSAKINSASLL